MTRTLRFYLLFALAIPVWAQSSQPSNVKVVAVPASQAKPSAVVSKTAPKPAVIAVKPAAKPAVAVAPAKPSAPNSKVQPNSKPVIAVVPAKPATPAGNVQAKPAVAAAKGAARSAVPTVAVKPDQHAARVVVAPKPVIAASGSKDPFSKNKKPQAVVAVPAAPKASEKKKDTVVAVTDSANAEKKPEPKKISSASRRDPFVSPVVHLGAVGSGCSSGKRCLAIDQIALKGVVRSENGMIAVVVNALDKAYFLRENDPVFNGYVTKITADSIVFKETFHDRLGKESTRDVTKTISRPAA
jgi:Tfp pilus assembly protein PilP